MPRVTYLHDFLGGDQDFLLFLLRSLIAKMVPLLVASLCLPAVDSIQWGFVMLVFSYLSIQLNFFRNVIQRSWHLSFAKSAVNFLLLLLITCSRTRVQLSLFNRMVFVIQQAKKVCWIWQYLLFIHFRLLHQLIELEQMTVAVVGILYIKAFNKKTLREQNNERHTSIFVDDDVTLCCLTHDFAHTIRVRRNDNHADPDPIHL